MSVRRPLLWALRVIWFVLGPVLAGTVGEAFEAFSRPVGVVAVILVWVGWAVGLLAVLVPSPLGLTAIRVAAPAGLGAAALSALSNDADPLALALASIAAVVALSAPLGDDFVDASSYGPERRLPLRVPGPLLLGPIPLAWLALVAGTTVGPLLLAGRAWVAGVIVTAVGLPLAAVAARALHQLSRRWIVYVPGGVVIHDHMAVLDPVLCRRNVLQAMTGALADTEATDLTLGALGSAVEILLSQPVDYVPAAGRRRTVELERSRAFLVTPTRPGRALELADEHRVPTRRPDGA
ncbi:MAG: hypothetical protein AAFZ07_17830 [Actinomycetota bacterium]